jgi:hypothetical protein
VNSRPGVYAGRKDEGTEVGQIDQLKDQIRSKIAEAEQAKAQLPADRSDSAARAFEYESVVNSGNREIEALEAYRKGNEIWPSERGKRT